RELGNAELQRPVLLKLDVQGYEARVLSGAANLLRRVDWLITEMAFVARYEGETLFPELLRTIESHGFRFVKPLGCNTPPDTGEISEMDVLFECCTKAVIESGLEEKDECGVMA